MQAAPLPSPGRQPLTCRRRRNRPCSLSTVRGSSKTAPCIGSTGEQLLFRFRGGWGVTEHCTPTLRAWLRWFLTHQVYTASLWHCYPFLVLVFSAEAQRSCFSVCTLAPLPEPHGSATLVPIPEPTLTQHHHSVPSPSASGSPGGYTCP